MEVFNGAGLTVTVIVVVPFVGGEVAIAALEAVLLPKPAPYP